jgi:hypothetical protein
MIDGMNANGNTRGRWQRRRSSDVHGLLGQSPYRLSVVTLAAHRRTILAIEGDIDRTNAQFTDQLTLQVKGFGHAWLHPAVMVTYRKLTTR